MDNAISRRGTPLIVSACGCGGVAPGCGCAGIPEKRSANGAAGMVETDGAIGEAAGALIGPGYGRNCIVGSVAGGGAGNKPGCAVRGWNISLNNPASRLSFPAARASPAWAMADWACASFNCSCEIPSWAVGIPRLN